MRYKNDSRDVIRLAEKLVPVQKLSTSVEAISSSLADYLEVTGLPTEGVLVPVDERRIVLNSFQDAVSVLPEQGRHDAYYLSKFVVAISMGLFDAALNYLWNETIAALRRLVARTDLAYFFDAVEKRPEIRKKLQTADDIPEIGEAMLVEGCYRIGLLNNLNYERLKHVNFMRNHASAAHPNQNDLTGAEMIGWLSNCLRYAITAEPSQEVVQVHRLLTQVRTNPLNPTDTPVIIGGLLRLPRPRIDDLLWTLFGIYCDTSQTGQTRSNIDLLAKAAWDASTEGRKHEVGVRYAEFVKHGEANKKTLAHQFLNTVDGLTYRAEEVLVVELLDKLRTLRNAHVGIDNFYNERNHARSLDQSLPPNGQVPAAVRREWVKIICTCYIGNGLGYREGVDEVAEPYYTAHITNFGEPEIIEFIDLFSDPDFVGDLGLLKPDRWARKVATLLKERVKQVHMVAALDQIINAPEKALDKIHTTSAFQRALKNIKK
jgi:hypothetical protein